MRLALRGLRNLDDGTHRVTDDAERAALAQQARIVILQATAAAVALGAATFLV